MTPGHDRASLSRTRPRSGDGVEAWVNADGTYDTHLDGRSWRYDQDWDEVARDTRARGLHEVQVYDETNYCQVVTV